MELCLGTVQFGMDYGINGKKKPTIKECVNCMDYAVCHGIKSIDTAAAYGNAEEVVGVFLKRKTVSREKLWISSKLMPNILDNVSPNRYKETIRNELTKSLTKLGTEYLDAYYFHSSRYSFNDEIALSSPCAIALSTSLLSDDIPESANNPERLFNISSI